MYWFVTTGNTIIDNDIFLPEKAGNEFYQYLLYVVGFTGLNVIQTGNRQWPCFANSVLDDDHARHYFKEQPSLFFRKLQVYIGELILQAFYNLPYLFISFQCKA